MSDAPNKIRAVREVRHFAGMVKNLMQWAEDVEAMDRLEKDLAAKASEVDAVAERIKSAEDRLAAIEREVDAKLAAADAEAARRLSAADAEAEQRLRRADDHAAKVEQDASAVMAEARQKAASLVADAETRAASLVADGETAKAAAMAAVQAAAEDRRIHEETIADLDAALNAKRKEAADVQASVREAETRLAEIKRAVASLTGSLSP